jgi:hypothetical protein
MHDAVGSVQMKLPSIVSRRERILGRFSAGLASSAGENVDDSGQNHNEHADGDH